MSADNDTVSSPAVMSVRFASTALTIYGTSSPSSNNNSDSDTIVGTLIYGSIYDLFGRVTRTTIPNTSPSSYDLSNNNPSSLNYDNDLNFDTVIYGPDGNTVV